MTAAVPFRNKLLNPFLQIAGGRSLAFGLAGICLNILLCRITNLHFPGLLHLNGLAIQNWFVFGSEHLIIWLVPALLFYLSGIFLSRSHIRMIDVLGTTAFAQLPLTGIALLSFSPPLQVLLQITPADITPEWLSQAESFSSIVLILISVLFLAWTLTWMFKALKVSCNLKGGRLVSAFICSVIIGDILSVCLIRFIYELSK